MGALIKEKEKKGILRILKKKDINFNVLDENSRYPERQDDLDAIELCLNRFIDKVQESNGVLSGSRLTHMDCTILQHCKIDLGFALKSKHFYSIDRFEQDTINNTYKVFCHELEVFSDVDCKGVADGTTFTVNCKKVQSKSKSLEDLTLAVDLSTLDVELALVDIADCTNLPNYYKPPEIAKLLENMVEKFSTQLK